MLKYKGLFICGLAAFFCIFDYLIQVLPSIITDFLMLDLNVSATGIGLISSSFYFSYLLMQVPAGYLIDTFGPRRCFFLAANLCALGSILFGMSTLASQAILGRICIGAGGAFSIVGTLYLISCWLPIRFFGIFAGLIQVMCCIGAISSQTILSFVYDLSSWRTIHYNMAMVAVSLSFLFILFIKIPPAKIDSSMITKSLSTAFNPFKEKKLYIMAFILMGSWAPIVILASLWGIPLLTQIHGLEKQAASSLISLIWIGVAIGSPFFGWLSSFIKQKFLIIDFGAGVAFVSSILLIYGPHSTPLICVALFCLGFAAGIQPVCFDSIQSQYPKSYHGTIFGSLNMAPLMGGLIFQPLVGIFLVHAWSGSMQDGIPFYDGADYKQALVVIPCFAAATLFGSQCLKSKTKQIQAFSY